MRQLPAGRYVVAVYEGESFLASVCEDQKEVKEGYVRLSYMSIKGTNQFSWPEKDDIMETCLEDVLMDSVDPVPVNSRGHLGLQKKEFALLIRKMVVIYYHLTVFHFIFSKTLSWSNSTYYLMTVRSSVETE